MEEVRLKVPSLRGVFLVLKMGPEQEICGHVVGDGQRSEGAELVGQIRTSALSERPAWSIDVKRQKLLRGPEPNNMFLQLWQGVELLGLARVSIPALRNENVRELCSGGSRNLSKANSSDSHHRSQLSKQQRNNRQVTTNCDLEHAKAGIACELLQRTFLSFRLTQAASWAKFASLCQRKTRPWRSSP
ncbi:unnamed protein product [Polarella glacialis]|uniref:Uncharacterized protein n=1 Tax=Polarella glacialis TaxID=89957 RepID=A0A813DEG3_POLGL|nr:unnamed protein product [Polarella glacialis]